MHVPLRVEHLEVRDMPASFRSLPVLPFSNLGVLDHARAIVARGRQLSLRTDTFVRFGDSNSSVYGIGNDMFAPYLVPLGAANYNPAATGLAATRPDLLDTWRVYSHAVNAHGVNSFTWVGPGAQPGFGTLDVLAGLEAD